MPELTGIFIQLYACFVNKKSETYTELVVHTLCQIFKEEKAENVWRNICVYSARSI